MSLPIYNIPIKGNYKKGYIEKGFEAEVFQYLRVRDYFCYHIQDIGLSSRLLDGIVITPYGETIYLEFKKVDGYTFNMSQFEDAQIDVLELMANRQVPAYILIYSQKTNTYVVTTYSYIKANRNEKGGVKFF